MKSFAERSAVFFHPFDILLPRVEKPYLWGTVACDQYTSEPDYWKRVYDTLQNEPSAAHLILPELYLEDFDVDSRISAIHETMKSYLEKGVLAPAENGYVYVERTLKGGGIRRGLVGMVDLLKYDFHPEAGAPVRATEKTVTERIPPRLSVREQAPVELSHVMLLIDDRQNTVIEPLSKEKESMKKLYDTSLMEGGGDIKGYCVDQKNKKRVSAALAKLGGNEHFMRFYGIKAPPLVMAVGDGNHSLAAAKAGYEKITAALPKEDALSHPSRYAMAELVNLHDESLLFEPIHRVLFDVEPSDVINAFNRRFGGLKKGFSSVECVFSGKKEPLYLDISGTIDVVEALQDFLDSYIAETGGKIDYIHGDKVMEDLAKMPGNMGFLLSPIDKNQLFETVIRKGTLPRKTFSMGHAADKRFYFEARKIR